MKPLQWLGSRWKTLPLGGKLIACYFGVLLVPLSVLMVNYYTTLQQSTYEQAQFVYASNLHQLREDINRKLANVERATELIVQSSTVRGVFGNPYPTERMRLIDYQMETSDFTKNILSLNTEMNAIFLYNDSMVICQMRNSFNSVRMESAPVLFDSLNLATVQEESRWILNRQELSNLLRPLLNPIQPIAHRRVVLDHSGRNHVAMVEIIISGDELFSGIHEQSGSEAVPIYAVDAAGHILASNTHTALSTIQQLGLTDYNVSLPVNRIDDQQLSITTPIPDLGVSLVCMVPLKSITGTMGRTTLSTALTMIGALTICSLAFYFLVRALLKSVQPMLSAMEEIKKGNYKTRLPTNRYDELGLLARNFNYMSEKLEEEVQRVYTLGQMEREAEFRAMEANMNPHFLYNSLATLSWIGRAHGVKEIVDTTQALARFYHMVLSKGQSVIPLQTEIKMVQAYLQVQKLRYEDRFETRYDIDTDAQDFPIIKNLLQPLVENAIEHGISPKNAKGLIRIQARRNGDKLTLSVSDNGVGMTPDQRREVLSGNITSSAKSSYAIYNITKRLKMFYGAGYEFSLHSTPGKGTTAVIMLHYTINMTVGGSDS